MKDKFIVIREKHNFCFTTGYHKRRQQQQKSMKII